jgi:hypothetical protein
MRGGIVKILGTVILAWLICDTLSAATTTIIAARKMGWARVTKCLKENKKELIINIITPLVLTILTICYITVTLMRGGGTIDV